MHEQHDAHRAGFATLNRALDHLHGPAPVDPDGLSPPHKDECHGLTAVAFEAETRENEHTDSAADGLAEQASQAQVLSHQSKRSATIAAELALRGFELRRTEFGTYIVQRWNLSMELRTLDDVQSFAQQIGAA